MATVFSHLLLATEHGEFDTGAEALALELARQWALPLDAVLPMVSNAEYEAVAPQASARADAEVSARRQHLQSVATAQSVDLRVTVRRGPEPYAEVVGAARDLGADLVVIRRRGRRGLLANLLVGEMVSKVVAHAPCSVLIAPRGAHLWSRRVLVGLDPLVPDGAILARAAGVAAQCALPLAVLAVVATEAARPQAEQALAAWLQRARALGVAADGAVSVGRPHQALIDHAAAIGADLLVVGRHGGDRLPRAWIGGTAQKVIGLATCPVLVHVDNPNAGNQQP